MPAVATHLPNHPSELKALLLKEQQTTAQLKQQIHALLEALYLEKHRRYGSSSEKAPGQSELFDEAEAEVLEEAGAENGADEAASTKTRKHSSRKPLPPELPRIRQVIELSEDQRQCPCGCTLVEIGEEISEQVDIIPAQVQIIQHVRKKYACKACGDTIRTAARPEVLLPKSIASGNTMASIIASKYADGLPLYRLSGILARYGIDLPRQTLSESVLKVAEQLKPLMERLRQHLLDYPLLLMDETRVQVLHEPGKSAQSPSYMWVQRGGPPHQPAIVFHYDPRRSAATAERLLAGYRGALMTDGYQAYRVVAQAKGLVHLCCWAHARRKFVEAQKAQPKGKTGKADMAIHFIAKLYAVEKHDKRSDAAVRQRNRQTRSKATLKAFHQWLTKTQQQVPPKTALGKAVNYTLDYWSELIRYADSGTWPMDNNAAENAIRPFVMGRKAWLFSNTQRGAQASANLYSLIETAKANGREPYRYLSWLFGILPSASKDNYQALMPWNAPI